MATFFITASGGGGGVQHSLADGDDILIGSDVERYSNDGSVIDGAGTNSVIVASNATVATFSSSFGEAAIKLGIGGDFQSGGNAVSIAAGATTSCAAGTEPTRWMVVSGSTRSAAATATT